MSAASKSKRPEVEVLRQQLARARAVLDEVERGLIEIAAANDAELPAISSEEDPGTIAEAQRIRQCSHETMVRHVIEKGLGRKVDGRWRVDLNRVRAWNERRAYDPIR